MKIDSPRCCTRCMKFDIKAREHKLLYSTVSSDTYHSRTNDGRSLLFCCAGIADKAFELNSLNRLRTINHGAGREPAILARVHKRYSGNGTISFQSLTGAKPEHPQETPLVMECCIQSLEAIIKNNVLLEQRSHLSFKMARLSLNVSI